MTLTLASLGFLVSARGQSLLARLEHEDLSEASTLKLLTTLRRDYTRDDAAAALTQARLRVRAVGKFGSDAGAMYFTDAALQQASHPLVRAYRAGLIDDCSAMIDACCGIGSDSISFAVSRQMDVLGIDLDPVNVALARLNAEALNLSNVRFAVGDVRHKLPDEADTIFFDPARRDGDRRLKHVEAYLPPLSTVRSWQARHVVVKLSPGVDLSQLQPYSGRIEFISVDGELKEAVLWMGDERIRQATLITGAEVLTWWRGDEPVLPPPEPPRTWLVEPDPSLIRAGLVQDTAAAFDGVMLDETIAYFTTHVRPQSPWVRAWRVLDWMPFNLKKLRSALRADNVGRVTVKKRGSPLTPEGLAAQLMLKGSKSRTLILTRFAGQSIVVICADYTV